MDFDLNVRHSKIEREQSKRREEAKRKLHHEKKLFEEQLIRDKILAEQARLRKIEEEKREEERLLREQEELLETGGIKLFVSTLLPYEIEGNDDKVILPERVLHELTAQDAFSKGPMYFKVIASLVDKDTGKTSVRITHVGVREFTAETSRIGLPRKVLDSLLSDENTEIAHVDIKYVRLPKCSFVKLRPKANDFFSVIPVKLMLEENLRLHSTLTEGDVLTVWYRGKSHILTVIELKPDQQGSLIDSDVEVDLEYSEEFQESQNTSSLNQVSNHNSISNESKSSANTDGPDKYRRLQDNDERPSEDDKMIIDNIDLPELTPEPDSSSPNIITVRVKSSQGVFKRRFRHDDTIAGLFVFVSQCMSGDVHRIQLSIPFPAKSFHFASSVKSGLTFESAGVTSSQETFIATIV